MERDLIRLSSDTFHLPDHLMNFSYVWCERFALKLAGRVSSWLTIPIAAEIKNARISASTPPYASIAWWLYRYSGNFTLHFTSRKGINVFACISLNSRNVQQSRVLICWHDALYHERFFLRNLIKLHLAVDSCDRVLLTQKSTLAHVILAGSITRNRCRRQGGDYLDCIQLPGLSGVSS
jgi:hypothetical protein